MINELVEWSTKEFSDLPWRKKRSLFGTLVSEIMLQQTTVSTVLNHFERFLDEYPDIHAVASASEEQLTMSWKGLGYYRRARNLKKACLYFQEFFHGEIPLEYEELIQAPGVGEYTANALMAIGANKRALALDANLERVLSRVYGIEMVKGPKLQKELARLFKEKKICRSMRAVGARKFNESLMDLGRNYCKANKTVCSLCPLSEECAAFKSGSPLLFPIKDKTNSKESFQLTLLRVLNIQDGKVLVFQKNEKQWLAGQYEVPTFILNSEDPSLGQYPLLDFEHHHWLPEYKTLITKYKISNKVLVCNDQDMKLMKLDLRDYCWRELDLQKLNLSSASLKAIDFIT